MNMRPTWAEVSLPTLRHNFRLLQECVAPDATVCAVLKADAYGHGAVACARALEAEGALWVGVTSTDEGLELRQAGISAHILLMTGFWRGEEEAVVRHDLTAAVWDWKHIELLEEAAVRLRLPENEVVPVHLKVDTGMGRLGASPSDVAMLARVMKSARHVVMEGVFTHLASSDVVDAPDVEAQASCFDDVAATIAESGLAPFYFHMANSAAVATRPRTWRSMVRPGIALYGYYLPFTSATQAIPDAMPGLPVRPVLSWKTRIISLRNVPAHQPLGYGGAYVTQAPARIAALPAGYADGLNRQLSSRGRVIVRDELVPIVGNISMDLTLVDVTSVPGVEVGDEVILMGASDRRSVTAREHAVWAKTIPYEILCGISKRVPRRYLE